MTVYVSLPQFPLTLKYEEPIADVATHLQALNAHGECHSKTMQQSFVFGCIVGVCIQYLQYVLNGISGW